MSPTDLSNSSALDKLLSVFTPEELDLVADAVVLARTRAVNRKSVQTFEIFFDEKGRARRVGGSDNFWLSSRYSPE